MDELDDILSSFLPEDKEADSGTLPDIFALMTRLAPVISALNGENDETRLIGALTPYLSEERREKAQQASLLLRLARVLPLLSGDSKEANTDERNEPDSGDAASRCT